MTKLWEVQTELKQQTEACLEGSNNISICIIPAAGSCDPSELPEIANGHYEEHRGKAFFEPLIEYMMSGPIVATVWEGKGVVAGGRSLLGATNPLKATPGTIRGDLGLDPGRNLCHASDSVNSANREINLWFSKNQIIHWKSDFTKWIYE